MALLDIPEYRVWAAMKRRCQNPNVKAWKYYGARGISVCDRWKNSYHNFIADMGHRPSKEYSIDRINNDGNYEPSNCRWATAKQQAANKRAKLTPNKIKPAGAFMLSAAAIVAHGYSTEKAAECAGVNHAKLLDYLATAKPSTSPIKMSDEARLRGISRQRVWQLRKIANGLCCICGKRKKLKDVERCGLCQNQKERDHSQVPCSPAFKAWLEKVRQERRQTYIVCLDRLMEEQDGKKPYVNNCV